MFLRSERARQTQPLVYTAADPPDGTGLLPLTFIGLRPYGRRPEY
jgi:hypothetical protein